MSNEKEQQTAGGLVRMSMTKLTSVKIDKLLDSKVQPPKRAQAGPAMTDLMESIKAQGVRIPPLIGKVGSRFHIANGHRTVEACRRLDYTEMLCLVFDAQSISEVEMQFAELDRVTRKMTGGDRLYGWVNATDPVAYLASVAKGQAKKIKQFHRIFGPAQTKLYAEEGINPCIVVDIKRVHTFLGDRLTDMDDEVPTSRPLGVWMIKHKMTGSMAVLTKTGGRREAAKVVQCIAQDKPYVFRKPRPAK